MVGHFCSRVLAWVLRMLNSERSIISADAWNALSIQRHPWSCIVKGSPCICIHDALLPIQHVLPCIYTAGISLLGVSFLVGRLSGIGLGPGCAMSQLPTTVTGVEGAVIVGKLLEMSAANSNDGNLGYNAATNKYEDMIQAGIIDPLKVRTLACVGWL